MEIERWNLLIQILAEHKRSVYALTKLLHFSTFDNVHHWAGVHRLAHHEVIYDTNDHDSKEHSNSSVHSLWLSFEQNTFFARTKV